MSHENETSVTVVFPIAVLRASDSVFFMSCASSSKENTLAVRFEEKLLHALAVTVASCFTVTAAVDLAVCSFSRAFASAHTGKQAIRESS